MTDGHVVLLSGGVDSTSLLALLADAGASPLEAIAVDYGQRHRVELEHAARVAAHFNAPLRVANCGALVEMFAGSSQTSDDVDVPEGHYTDESMRATVVPGRNLFMLSLACAYAASRELSTVAYAAHAGDHPVYPDCRPDFVDAARLAMRLGYDVDLYAPFLAVDKAEVVRTGHVYGAPFELTWSCYRGEPPLHCGRCGTCVERREAFALAHVHDPTAYAT